MKTVTYAVLLCLTSIGAARAQTWEFGITGGYPRWSRAPLGSASTELIGDTDTRLKGDYSFGASVTRNTKGYYGFELGYLKNITELTSTEHLTVNNVLTSTVYKDRLPVHVAYFNPILYFMPKNEKWRPFVTAGGQAYEFRKPHGIPNWPSGHTRHYGFNFGGGIKLRLFSHALVRADLRDYIGGKPYGLAFANSSNSGGLIHMIEGTVGFALTF